MLEMGFPILPQRKEGIWKVPGGLDMPEIPRIPADLFQKGGGGPEDTEAVKVPTVFGFTMVLSSLPLWTCLSYYYPHFAGEESKA